MKANNNSNNNLSIYERQMLEFINESGIINQNKVYSADDLKIFLSTVVKTSVSVMKAEEAMVSQLTRLGQFIENTKVVETTVEKRKPGRPRKNSSTTQLDLFGSSMAPKSKTKTITPQEDGSTSPLSDQKRVSCRAHGYTQDHSLTIPKMNQIRISKRNGHIRPMVVDYELAHALFMDNYTHVQLVSSLSKDNKKCLLFSKENVRTRAPRANHSVSRLNIYGYSKNEVSTYSINSQNFQKSIAKAFDIDLDELPNDSQVVIQLSEPRTSANGKKVVSLEKVISIK